MYLGFYVKQEGVERCESWKMRRLVIGGVELELCGEAGGGGCQWRISPSRKRIQPWKKEVDDMQNVRVILSRKLIKI